VFYGEYASTVDDKGRVVIPARLRDVAQATGGGPAFVMRLGEDGCVTLCAPERWKEQEEEMNKAPQNARSARRRRRFVFSQAEAGQCDAQGRLRVSPRLLEGAGITRDVVVVGVSDQIELWETARWRAFKEEMMAEKERDAESYPGSPAN
jgi:MraZ protein